MRAPTTLKLVRGLHPETPVPTAAQLCGWTHRTAVVIDSYVPGLADMYFDSALFLRFLQRIDDLIAGTSRHITVIDPRSGQSRELMSVAELQDFYHDLPEDERDLPQDIFWFDDVVPVAGGFAENWDMVGGPEIYHDSFTLSVFTKKDIFPALAAAAGEICAESHARLLAVHEGTPLT